MYIYSIKTLSPHFLCTLKDYKIKYTTDKQTHTSSYKYYNKAVCFFSLNLHCHSWYILFCTNFRVKRFQLEYVSAYTISHTSEFKFHIIQVWFHVSNEQFKSLIFCSSFSFSIALQSKNTCELSQGL